MKKYKIIAQGAPFTTESNHKMQAFIFSDGAEELKEIPVFEEEARQLDLDAEYLLIPTDRKDKQGNPYHKPYALV